MLIHEHKKKATPIIHASRCLFIFGNFCFKFKIFWNITDGNFDVHMHNLQDLKINTTFYNGGTLVVIYFRISQKEKQSL